MQIFSNIYTKEIIYINKLFSKKGCKNDENFSKFFIRLSTQLF